MRAQACVLVLVCACSTAAEQLLVQEPRLVVDNGKASYLVRPDGLLERGVPGPTTHEIWAPGRKHKLLVTWEYGSVYTVVIADAAGKPVVNLTKEHTRFPAHYLPSWSPDGARLAFDGHKNDTQIHAVELPSGTIKKLTNQPRGATRPQYLPDGRLAYLARGEDSGQKFNYSDIVINDGTNDTVIVKKQFITDFAVSPNGSQLAYDSIHDKGQLKLLELKSGQERILGITNDIADKLYAHGAHDIVWRPDGKALACQFNFLGGRLVVGEGPFEPMAGDREVFILPLEGKSAMYTTPNADPHLLYWR